MFRQAADQNLQLNGKIPGISGGRLPLLRSRPRPDSTFQTCMTGSETSVRPMTAIGQLFPMTGPSRVRVSIWLKSRP
jgi:hypothetical protein